MSALPKRREPLAGGSTAQCTDNDARILALGRPEFQGKAANGRNRDQKPPRWQAPAGWHALELLERLWGKS